MPTDAEKRKQVYELLNETWRKHATRGPVSGFLNRMERALRRSLGASRTNAQIFTWRETRPLNTIQFFEDMDRLIQSCWEGTFRKLQALEGETAGRAYFAACEIEEVGRLALTSIILRGSLEGAASLVSGALEASGSFVILENPEPTPRFDTQEEAQRFLLKLSRQDHTHREWRSARDHYRAALGALTVRCQRYLGYLRGESHTPELGYPKDGPQLDYERDVLDDIEEAAGGAVYIRALIGPAS